MFWTVLSLIFSLGLFIAIVINTLFFIFGTLIGAYSFTDWLGGLLKLGFMITLLIWLNPIGGF